MFLGAAFLAGFADLEHGDAGGLVQERQAAFAVRGGDARQVGGGRAAPVRRVAASPQTWAAGRRAWRL